MGVAQFPWDPKPEPPPPANNPPAPAVTQPPPQAPSSYVQAQVNMAAPQNAPLQQQQHTQQQQNLSLPGMQQQQQQNPQQTQANYSPQIKSEPGLPLPRNEPVIKQEPGTSNGGMPSLPQAGYAAGPPRPGMAVAQARAVQALESQYGQRAQASISALQGQQYQNQPQAQRPGQPQQQTQFQQPQYQQQQQNHPQQQQQNAQQAQMYRQQLAQQMAAQQAAQARSQQGQQGQQAQQPQYPNGQHQNGVHKSQVDGASDAYEGILMQRGADGNPLEMGRMEIDGYLHAQFAARAKQLEGGGLMLPLKKATKTRSLPTKVKREASGPSQLDGLSDDEDDPVLKEEEFDEDAINSDLDDPDDNQEEDEDDDDSMGHLMLCMYDKVQRVKNKWLVFPILVDYCD